LTRTGKPSPRLRLTKGPGAPAVTAAAGRTTAAARERELREFLARLGAAKQGLLDATAALRAVDGRVRLWDLGEPFMARRGHALRAEATARFGRALDQLHGLLQHLEAAPRALPRRGQSRRLLIQIRSELRYLQRAFDGGSLLLARALDSFTASTS